MREHDQKDNMVNVTSDFAEREAAIPSIASPHANDKLRWKLKIYGERNSGTNFLEQLMDYNLDAEVLKFLPGPLQTLALKMIRRERLLDIFLAADSSNTLGWKHGIPRESWLKETDMAPLLIVIVVKSPYAFLTSLYRKPYHYRGKLPTGFSEFLQSEWRLHSRDGLGRSLPNPVELWNRKHERWLQLKHECGIPFETIRYESLVAEPEKVLRDIHQRHDIPLLSKAFTPITTSTKNAPKTIDDYREDVTQKTYLEPYSGEDLDFIRSQLNPQLMETLGYNFESTITRSR